MNINSVDMEILKSRLIGGNLIELLKKKKLSKWRVAKDCDLTYRTILNWVQEKTKPTDENAIKVGKYFSLIGVDEVARQKEIDDIKEKIRRLESD